MGVIKYSVMKIIIYKNKAIKTRNCLVDIIINMLTYLLKQLEVFVNMKLAHAMQKTDYISMEN